MAVKVLELLKEMRGRKDFLFWFLGREVGRGGERERENERTVLS